MASRRGTSAAIPAHCPNDGTDCKSWSDAHGLHALPFNLGPPMGLASLTDRSKAAPGRQGLDFDPPSARRWPG